MILKIIIGHTVLLFIEYFVNWGWEEELSGKPEEDIRDQANYWASYFKKPKYRCFAL